jgi:predicted DNA binding protein
MHEAVFRIEGDGAYAVATAGTDASVELWCNDHCDLLYVTEDATDEILAHVRERVGVQDLLRRPDELVVVTADCLTHHEDDLIETYLARHNCLLLPPLRYAGGAKSCRVLALDPAALTACYRDLIEDGFSVTVERKREIETVAHDAPLLTLDGVLPDHPSLANSNGRLSDGSEPFLKDWAFLMDFLGVRYHSF